jgi:hypothetical protein
MITIVCFGAVATYEITAGDLPLTIRIACVVALLRWFMALHPSNLTGPAWEGYGRSQWFFSVGGLSIGALLWVWCLVAASVNVFIAVVLLSLMGPMMTLYNTIHDAARTSSDS